MTVFTPFCCHARGHKELPVKEFYFGVFSFICRDLLTKWVPSSRFFKCDLNRWLILKNKCFILE